MQCDRSSEIRRDSTILHGVREIAAFLGVGTDTAQAWSLEFKGDRDPDWVLPVVRLPSNTMRRWQWLSDKEVIRAWITRWAARDTRERMERGSTRVHNRRRSLPAGGTGGSSTSHAVALPTAPADGWGEGFKPGAGTVYPGIPLSDP